MTTVSVVIPCFNEEKTIALLLDAIYQQSYPTEMMEVVIADGMSTDRTLEVIANYSHSHEHLVIKVVDNRERNIPAGLNRAIEASKGSIIVRMDAHSIPDHDYVERAVENLMSGKGDNVGGQWDIQAGADTWIAQSIAVAASHPLAVGGVSYRIGGQAKAVDTVPFGSFNRELFDEIGKFDEDLLSNEDYDLNTRIRKQGGTVWFDPQMKIKYFARPTFAQLAKQYWRYGYWKLQMLRKYPESLRFRQAIPPLFLLSLVFLVIIGIFVPFVIYAFLLELGIYVTTLLFIGMINAIKNKNPSFLIGIPVSIAVMHFSWGAGFIFSALGSIGKS